MLEMMEGEINAAGGVLGRPLEIVIEDDKSDPKEAVTAANRLIDQEKAVALIAATGSASTLAVKAITAEKGLPQMAMAAANDITDKAPMEWIWRTPQKDAMAAGRALTYISETLKVKKIAVLHDENAFGSSGAAEIAETAADYGLEIVATESYKTDDTDLTAQLTKIKGESPEVLIVWGTNPGPALAAKNMKQLGMDDPLRRQSRHRQQEVHRAGRRRGRGRGLPGRKPAGAQLHHRSGPEGSHRRLHRGVPGRVQRRVAEHLRRATRSRPSTSGGRDRESRVAPIQRPSRRRSTRPRASPVRTGSTTTPRPITTV